MTIGDGGSLWRQLQQVRVDRNGVHAPVRADRSGIRIGDPEVRITPPAGEAKPGLISRLLARLRRR